MIVLLVAFARAAAPLAPYPEPSPVVAHQCREAVGIEAGKPFPHEIGGPIGAACSGVLVPTSDAADLLTVESWAIACRDTYAVVTVANAQQLAAMTIDRDRWKDAALGSEKELRRAQRWYRKPGVNFALGVLVTGAAVGGGAYLATL